jgi:hypothetical protein
LVVCQIVARLSRVPTYYLLDEKRTDIFVISVSLPLHFL